MSFATRERERETERENTNRNIKWRRCVFLSSGEILILRGGCCTRPIFPFVQSAPVTAATRFWEGREGSDAATGLSSKRDVHRADERESEDNGAE